MTNLLPFYNQAFMCST